MSLINQENIINISHGKTNFDIICFLWNHQKQNLLRILMSRIITILGEEILAKKYRIRMRWVFLQFELVHSIITRNIVLKCMFFMTWRGIDAPELKMASGKESRNALVKLIGGKRVTIYVYGQDQFGRYVGDIYCDNVFIQVKK